MTRFNQPQLADQHRTRILQRTTLAAAMTLALHPAMAANINVTAGAVDDSNSSGNCSLREAIESAENDTGVDLCTMGVGDDVVILPAGSTYTLSVVDNTTANGPNGLPEVTTNITIQGNGSTIQRSGAAPDFRLFEVSGSGYLSIYNTTLSNGVAPASGALQDGGAVLNSGTNALVVNNSTISGNSAYSEGGGLAVSNTGNLELTDSTVSGNSARRNGGGIYVNDSSSSRITRSTISGNTAGNDGGGLYNYDGDPLTIIDSTVSGNSAGVDGGGIYSKNTVTVISSTVSGNFAGNYGGGIYNENDAFLYNCTISGNSAGTSGGGLFAGSNETLVNCTVSSNTAPAASGIDATGRNSNGADLTNTIVAGNLIGAECAGSLGTNTNNWFGDASCDGAADGAPGLAPLGNYGGPTQTMALLPGAGPIDQGNNPACANFPLNNQDQRGQTRPGDVVGDVSCDIGAFERQDADITAAGIPLLSPAALLTLILGLFGLGSLAERRRRQT